MAKEKTYKGQWSSDRAETKYRAKEAAVWKRAKRPPEAIDVATHFGSTRAYRWPGSGTPIVFLHGMTDNSVRWIRYAEALDGHDVYAIDIMGDVGHSKPDIGYSSADDYAVWLAEALAALGITRPHVVGASLGGYIALSYAMKPERVASVIGLDPVGVADLKLFRLMRWSVRCAMASFAPEPIRRRLADRLRMPLLNDKAERELMLQAQRGHPIKLPLASTFSDEQLQSITAPVYVLAGAKSKAFDAEQLVARTNNIIPQGEARLLPEAGHALTESHFDECLAMIRQAIAAPADSSQQ
ncbi:MAG: alpha/beta fold hydrolase [Acidimicrobiales bacterium]